MAHDYRSVDKLLKTLLDSDNDAWRDDAAEELAKSPDVERAEEALFLAIESPKLDDSLRRTSAESLAEIWIRRGGTTREKICRLSGTPRVVAEEFLRVAGLLPNGTCE